jgi:ankyrin repeat protein
LAIKVDPEYPNREDGRTQLHLAAQRGDMDAVEKILNSNKPEILHAKDSNNWQAIHEAARGNNLL